MVTRLLNIREVCSLTSLSRTTIYRLQKAGDFPHSVPVSFWRVAWLADEIDEYIESCVARRAA